MGTYIVLLRAVNVGGRNKVPMAELRTAVEAAGFGDVGTYVQSGNLICSSRKKAPGVATAIHKLVEAEFGHDIEVIVRTPAELAALDEANPYPDADPKQSGVVFLAAAPDGPLDASKFAPDTCVVSGADVFVHCPSSFADTKLTAGWVEKQVGQAGTRRNWNTIHKLVQLAGAQS